MALLVRAYNQINFGRGGQAAPFFVLNQITEMVVARLTEVRENSSFFSPFFGFDFGKRLGFLGRNQRREQDRQLDHPGLPH